jgi:phosphatidylglycerol lysyltransferase
VFRLEDAFESSIKMLFLMEPSVLGKLSKIKMVYIQSSIDINWIGLLFVLYFVLKPLVYQPIVTAFDKERVRNLLQKYGDNPTSYVSLESDKKYFFGKNIEGVVVYTIAAKVSVCVGDPICSDENMPLLVAEFITYCKKNDLEICFCETMARHIPLYTELGFSNTKYGEEAMFDLEIYNLNGKKAAKIRNAINHASALGITVEEYQPLKNKNRIVEQQISDVSREWLESKKSGELSFMMGTISLDNPMDRRYFVALDRGGKILGFIVFSPFQGGKGYFADVTRRRNSAPIGVMETIMIDAFKKMKAEGVKWGSLGNAPLANVGEDGGITGKLLEIIYEKFNIFYGFKNLHHYKKKYGPTSWEPKYLVYYSKMFTPQIAYAIIKAQNPKGVSDFVLGQLKSIFSGW